MTSIPFSSILLATALFLHHARGTPAHSRCNPYATPNLAIGSFTDATGSLPNLSGAGISIAVHNGSLAATTTVITPAVTGRNPTYVAESPLALYTINSLSPSGYLVALSFSRRAPYVSTEARVELENQRPTHVAVVSSKRWRDLVVVANVNGGTLQSFTYAHGRLRLADTFTVPAELASQVRNPELTNRQRLPHPHMALPYHGHVIVPDLGADYVFVVSINARTGALSETQRVEMRAGDGPRHAVAHASGVVFVANELSASVATLVPGPDRGLAVEEYTELLDEGGNENTTAAAIRLSRDGRFLYVSVRPDGRDTPIDGVISGFEVSRAGRILRKVGQWSSYGVHPRDFELVEDLSVDGECVDYVAVANRDTDEVVFVRRDKESGVLGAVEFTLAVNSPSSVLPLKW